MSDEKNKVYVGNLEYGVTDTDIKTFFQDKGITAKSVEIIKDKYTGNSKGFGFAELDSEEAVQKAIELLDGQELKGRRLRINKAKKPKERFERGEGGYR